jgi:hypothetical protein
MVNFLAQKGGNCVIVKLSLPGAITAWTAGTAASPYFSWIRPFYGD